MIPSPRPAPDDEHDDDLAARAAELRALVDAAVAGDREAFGQVWTAYRLDVFRFVRYRVPSRVLAEDLTSETCLRSLRSIGTFSWQGRDFGAWLFTIARNLINDHYKSARHRVEFIHDDMHDLDPAEPGADDHVIAHLADQDRADAVHDALWRLTDHQRACITARYLDELSVAATADRLGCNDGAIKTLTMRAVHALARDRILIGALAT